MILNGPGLNYFGRRELEIYGIGNMEKFYKECAEKLEVTLRFYQSNCKGRWIEWA